MAFKISVMGEAGPSILARYLELAIHTGKAIALNACVRFTGACPGLPLAAARGAKSRGLTAVGISSALSFDEHALQLRFTNPY